MVKSDPNSPGRPYAFGTSKIKFLLLAVVHEDVLLVVHLGVGIPVGPTFPSTTQSKEPACKFS